LYNLPTDPEKVLVNTTPPDFTGDYSVVVFPFVKAAGKAPDIVAGEIGNYLQEQVKEVRASNVVKGFLNLEIADAYWNRFLNAVADDVHFGEQPRNGKKVMVEFSSPNTNKPLHLGHIRNILLGWSCSQILDAAGYDVVKVQVINDRGVAICKSMVSWLKFGNGQTPENSGIKGDHLVGDYYVLFENKVKAEYEAWQQTDAAKALYAEKHKDGQSEQAFYKEYKNKWFNDHSLLGAEVRDMLLRWENGDPETIALWKTMNAWVYAGFDQTYNDLGVSFDKLYYESDTYLLGKDIVEEGLQKGVFYKKDDGSVWVDLTDAGHDHKVVLRADGTSVYITQDMGTSRMRFEDFQPDRMVYVVADEQNYHFAVLFETLKRLGEPYADGLYHLSYGLVELPTGRMKTREGTVVDADDLVQEVTRIATEQSLERGETDETGTPEHRELMHVIGMGALKFFIIKVHPKKKMIFNPEESVDMQGQTGPYVQYSYVRIHKLLQRASEENVDLTLRANYEAPLPQEKELLIALHGYPAVVKEAAENYDPSLLANYCYALAKAYHRFFHDVTIFRADTEAAKAYRLTLSKAVGQVLRHGMHLLGIEMPAKM
jgi:arginyl-tRNA synthetase